MPELPEVEALALDLRGRFADRAIAKVHVVIATVDRELHRQIQTSIDRRDRENRLAFVQRLHREPALGEDLAEALVAQMGRDVENARDVLTTSSR